MGYIGSQPATNFETVRKQVSTTNSGTTITLDYSVSSVQDILVTVNAVVQSYDNYSVSGTTLTLGGTLNNDRVEILYVGRTFQTVTPAVGTVTNDMLVGSIANSKLANSSITLNGSAVSLGGSVSLPSGAFTYINGTSSTTEVSALTLDSVFSSSYQNYLIVFGITVINGANGRQLLTRVRHGGSTVTTSSYHTALADFDTQVTSAGNLNYSSSNNNNATSIQVGGPALSNSGNLKTCSGTIFLYDMNKSDEFKTMLIDNVSQDWNGYTQRNIAVGQYLADQAIDGITFFANSDNLREGYFRVYGIADS